MIRTSLVAVLVALAGGPLAAEEIPVGAYRRELEAIRAGIERGDVQAVRDRASALAGLEVRHGDEVLPPDRTVLGPLSKVESEEAARAVLPRLDRVLEGLRAVEDRPAAAPGPDRELLDTVRADQSHAGPEEGGEVGRLPTDGIEPDDLGLAERIGSLLDELGDWILEKLRDLGDWLSELWPDDAEPAGSGSSVPAGPWVVVVLVVVLGLILGVVAFRILRSRREEPEATIRPDGPRTRRQDEDPLSRTVGEWERYAIELARQGLYRDAARAWYHSVLVTLCQTGLLHYRKGRTNWEYVAALEPGFAHRGAFVEITRHFDRAWYGHEDPTPEDLDSFAGRARSILDALPRGARR